VGGHQLMGRLFHSFLFKAEIKGVRASVDALAAMA